MAQSTVESDCRLSMTTQRKSGVDSRDLAEVQRTLWAAADELRANSTLAAASTAARCSG